MVKSYSAKLFYYIHNQKRATCNKSVDILQQLVTTSQDAFAWLSTACDNKSVASCQQVCFKLSTDLLQVDYCKLFQQVVNVCKWQVVTILILTDLLQLDEIDKLVATCWQVANKPVKLTTCNNSVGFLAVYRQLATAFKYFLVDFTMQLVRQWQWNNVDETRLMHIWPHMNREWTHISSIFF